MADAIMCATVEDVIAATPHSGFYPVEAWPIRGGSLFTIGALWAWPNGSRSWRLFHGGTAPCADSELIGRRIGARIWMPGEPRETQWAPVVAYMQAAVAAFPGQVTELRHDTMFDPYDGDVMDSVHVKIATLPAEDVQPWIVASDRIHREVEGTGEALVGRIALHVTGGE